MKANEAPEKIILSADRDTQIIYDEWVINDYTDNIKIEYAQTDAFIEKAKKWFIEHTNIPQEVETNADGEPLADSYVKYAQSRFNAAIEIFEDFKRYMEE